MKAVLSILLLITIITSCGQDDDPGCDTTAKVKIIESDDGCQYFYFETSDGSSLYPDENFIDPLDPVLFGVDLAKDKSVGLSYVELGGNVSLSCLIQLAPGKHIKLNCITDNSKEVVIID